jgi:hypothetical protein
MKTAFRSALAMFVLLFLMDAALARQSPLEVAEQWGLRGSWALHCDQPASRSNPLYFYEQEGGILVIRVEYGDMVTSSDVINASIVGDGDLEMTYDYKTFSQVRTIRLARDQDGKMHAVSNRDDKGNYSIRDGKFTGNGSPSLAFTHCKTGT